MARHNELGQAGELKAAEYMQQQGYVILERNWRIGKKELDLICLSGNLLVVVEVKTRFSPEDRPEELLDARKRKNLQVAADAYIRSKKMDVEVRFDLILVEGENSAIRHIPDVIRIFDD